ncbi:MAG: CHAT domain-containing protein [Anaerolineales bacterium]|nr:CHAT domain-containing protein [Anaerolineales bacterium]
MTPLVQQTRSEEVAACADAALRRNGNSAGAAAAELHGWSRDRLAKAPAQAWVYADAAVRLAPPGTTLRLDCQVGLALALNELGEFQAALRLVGDLLAAIASSGRTDLMAWCALAKVRAYVELRQHRSAEAALTHLEAQLSKHPNLLIQARATRLKAQLFHYRSDQVAALETAQHALALSEALGEPLEVLRAQIEVARPQFMSNPEAVLSAMREVEPQLIDRECRVDAAFARHLRGLALDRLNRYEEALALFDINHATFVGEAMEHYVAWTDNMRCILLWRLNRYDEALAVGNGVRSYFAGRKIAVWQAMCNNNLAIVHYVLRQYEAAADLYGEAAEICRQEAMEEDEARCRANLGLVWAETGRYDLALLETQRARSLFLQCERRTAVADCDQNLAHLLLKLGRPEDALAQLWQARQGFVEQARTLELALIDIQLAELLLALDRPADAAPVAAQAQQVLAQAHLAHHAALAGRSHGLALMKLGRVAEGMSAIQAAQAHFQRSGLQVDAAVCDLDLGEWCGNDTAALDEAERHLRTALAVLAPLQPAEAWRGWAGLARVAQQRGDRAAALSAWMAALQVVTALRTGLPTEHGSSGYFTAQARLYTEALAVALEERAYTQALQIVEAAKTQVFVNQIGVRTAALGTTDPYIEQLAAEERRLRSELDALRADQRLGFQAQGGGVEPERASAQIKALGAAYEAAVDALRVAQPRAGLALAPAELALEALRSGLALLAQPWACLSYHLDGDQLLVLYLDAEQLRSYPVRLSAYDLAMLRQATDRSPGYRELVYSNRILGKAAQQPHLRHLAKLLLPPEVAQLSPQHVLYIAPHKQLHTLPFGVLNAGAGPLLERALPVVAPSLAALQRLVTLAPGREREGRALVCGVAHFQGRAADLPAALAETEALLARLGANGDALLGDAATRDAWLALSRSHALGGYSLIHIATHTQSEPAAPSRTALLLADDALSLYDIMNLQLAADVVVLSACSSGVGHALAGNELMNLAWAWLQAGAQTVVASLWPVTDQAAAAFMDAFYRNLLVAAPGNLAGRVAPALRAAQQELRAAGFDMIDWSPWIVIGAG